MEDIVAIKVFDKKKRSVAFLTWGRVFDRTDPKPLREAVSGAAAKFGLHHITSIVVCDCLQSVADHKYFFEALAAISRQPVPFGLKTYKPWAAKIRKAISSGKELYFLGGVFRSRRKKARKQPGS